MSNIFRIIIGLGLLSGILLLINILVYKFTGVSADITTFKYPLTVVYAFFYMLSSIILFALTRVSIKNHEQLGYSFLFLTAGKMALSYIMARPIIAKGAEAGTEKVNFFIIFIVYLVIEAYYTARLLNNKQ